MLVQHKESQRFFAMKILDKQKVRNLSSEARSLLEFVVHHTSCTAPRVLFIMPITGTVFIWDTSGNVISDISLTSSLTLYLRIELFKNPWFMIASRWISLYVVGRFLATHKQTKFTELRDCHETLNRPSRNDRERTKMRLQRRPRYSLKFVYVRV
jgi:hypothetical protein